MASGVLDSDWHCWCAPELRSGSVEVQEEIVLARPGVRNGCGEVKEVKVAI